MASAVELDFPSEAWVLAYKDAINANAEYAKAGKDWTHGVVAMVVKAEPALDIPEDTAMWLDVHEGRCRECKLLPAKDAERDAPFVVVASYAQWKQVIKKEVDPTKALMQGKLKLTKGHMPTMVKHVNASKQLVESTSRVPTKFRGE
ncbi:MAG: SCP2 sterol-binding domain-containing protein [Labilithrix sp.]|nr:SCP2 sterol-binding domain-containing protein [Labilithrix sp.]MCW5833072.1 SCP2 sterol-binding domain-containing protein [Labilithrix sp.]